MDSRERDERAKIGFSERGEILYRGKRKKFKRDYDYNIFKKTTEKMMEKLNSVKKN